MNYFSKALLSMKKTSCISHHWIRFGDNSQRLQLNGYKILWNLQFVEGLTSRLEKYNVYDKQEQPPSD